MAIHKLRGRMHNYVGPPVLWLNEYRRSQRTIDY